MGGGATNSQLGDLGERCKLPLSGPGANDYPALKYHLVTSPGFNFCQLCMQRTLCRKMTFCAGSRDRKAKIAGFVFLRWSWISHGGGFSPVSAPPPPCIPH